MDNRSYYFVVHILFSSSEFHILAMFYIFTLKQWHFKGFDILYLTLEEKCKKYFMYYH